MGQALLQMGLRNVGTPLGIICAMVFVSAPLFVSAARESITQVPVRLENAACTRGDSLWQTWCAIVLDAGRVVQSGNPEQMLREPLRTDVKLFLGEF